MTDDTARHAAALDDAEEQTRLAISHVAAQHDAPGILLTISTIQRLVAGLSTLDLHATSLLLGVMNNRLDGFDGGDDDEVEREAVARLMAACRAEERVR